MAASLAPVTFKTDRNCRVASGEWFGAFTAATVSNPSKLDIDHVVPLANSHRPGGWAWSAERKRAYLNSLEDPDHPITVTASANGSKGARGPESWRPANESYWWEYARDWTRIKQTWGLTMTDSEAQALHEMLARG